MLEQPDHVEIGASMYGCGECPNRLLDRVFIHVDTPKQDEWLACPNCGWDDLHPESKVRESEWYQERYG